MVSMRWDNLRLDLEASTAEASTAEASTAEASTAEASTAEASTAEASTAEASTARAGEPLLPRGAVARTFDTPGFRGMTFYEIHAKSIVSRVPEASRVPFRWTINPYRGCQHSCLLLLRAQYPHLPRPGRWA
jgi:hypothetical protein